MKGVILISIFIFIEISIVFSKLPSSCPNIITKNQWGGREALEIQHIIIPVQYIIIHHTVTPTCSDENACSKRIVSMQTYHMDKLGFNDIGYNFLVGGDGNVYEGAGWNRQGAHTRGYNSKSLGIGFIGDFTSKAPNSKQIEAGKKLIECAVQLKELDQKYKLLGARSVRATESPGNALFQEIQSWKGFSKSP